jgi:hypothetical protein
MSKGSGVRPHNKKKFDKEYERVFGAKPLNVWQDAPPKEEEPNDGIQGSAEDGTCNPSDSGCPAYMPQESGGEFDPQTGTVVETSRHGTRRTVRATRPPDTDYWTYTGYRGEFACPCGVGHGNHIHGCCPNGCCQRDDFPLRRTGQ